MKRERIYNNKVQSKLTDEMWAEFNNLATENLANEAETLRYCIDNVLHFKKMYLGEKAALKIAAEEITEKIELNANQAKTIRELSDKLTTLTKRGENTKHVEAENIKLHGTIGKFEADLRHSRELNVSYLRNISELSDSVSKWKLGAIVSSIIGGILLCLSIFG